MIKDFSSLKFETLMPPKQGAPERVTVGVKGKGTITVTFNAALRNRFGEGVAGLNVSASWEAGRGYLKLAPDDAGWPLVVSGRKAAQCERSARVYLTAHPFEPGVIHNAVEVMSFWQGAGLIVEMPDWDEMRAGLGEEGEE